MYRHLFKRAIDIILSLIGAILLIPLTIIVAPLIWLEDKGSIFYNSERIGKNGKMFKMHKYRSMKTNAPDIRNRDGSTYNSENDMRVTKIGKVLRKTSLDEMPQLINVLSGDMSLVGPRPMVKTRDSKKPSKKDTKDLKKILSIKPGITGYSQAYFRNSIPQTEKRKNDIFYVENYSLLFDIKIVFKTISSVIKKSNINRTKQ